MDTRLALTIPLARITMDHSDPILFFPMTDAEVIRKLKDINAEQLDEITQAICAIAIKAYGYDDERVNQICRDAGHRCPIPDRFEGFKESLFAQFSKEVEAQLRESFFVDPKWFVKLGVEFSLTDYHPIGFLLKALVKLNQDVLDINDWSEKFPLKFKINLSLQREKMQFDSPLRFSLKNTYQKIESSELVLN